MIQYAEMQNKERENSNVLFILETFTKWNKWFLILILQKKSLCNYHTKQKAHWSLGSKWIIYFEWFKTLKVRGREITGDHENSAIYLGIPNILVKKIYYKNPIYEVLLSLLGIEF